MLTLYNVPVSIYGAKVRVALRHKELQWDELAPIGGYGSDAYKQVVPSGNVPALLHEDLLLADSEAITEYIEEAFPDPPMMPSGLEARAKMRELSRFHDTRLEPEVRALFAQVAPEKRDLVVIEQRFKAINTRLNQLAVLVDRRRKSRDSKGAHPTVSVEQSLPLALGDCGYPGTCAWIEAMADLFGLTIEWPGAVRAYLSRLEQQDAVATEMGIYRPVIADWIATKQRLV